MENYLLICIYICIYMLYVLIAIWGKMFHRHENNVAMQI